MTEFETRLTEACANAEKLHTPYLKKDFENFYRFRNGDQILIEQRFCGMNAQHRQETEIIFITYNLNAPVSAENSQKSTKINLSKARFTDTDNAKEDEELENFLIETLEEVQQLGATVTITGATNLNHKRRRIEISDKEGLIISISEPFETDEVRELADWCERVKFNTGIHILATRINSLGWGQYIDVTGDFKIYMEAFPHIKISFDEEPLALIDIIQILEIFEGDEYYAEHANVYSNAETAIEVKRNYIKINLISREIEATPCTQS